jgi:hypothetical protein
MTKDPFESSANLTQKRKDYAKRLFVGCCQSLASDLDQGEVTEEVGIFALGQMLAAYTPHTGEGHASATRAWVADQVAALRTPDAAQEAQAQEAQAQEAPAQEAPAQEAPAQEAPAQEGKLARRKAA